MTHEEKNARMFQSPFLEAFTKTHWTLPLFFYLPIAGFMLWQSRHLALLAIPALIISGIIFWTLAEYSLHRFVFHWVPANKLGKRFHFLIHGVHHDYPNDALRLVMPPLVSLPAAILFYILFTVLLGAYAPPFFAGFLLGYLYYDLLHYSIHHAPMKGKIAQYFKLQHMKHHFQNEDSTYGVTTRFWDNLFKTGPKSESH
jgi:sterol desaturase/sphingolipid hydroxylase (fatty acid hydroxylase superfamily)